LSADVKVIREIVQSNKKQVKKIRKNRGSTDARLQNELKMILLHFKIVRVAYHGGDLTGGNLIYLFDKADDIFCKFKETLKGTTRKLRCEEEEIMKMCQKTKELCILFNLLFSLAQTTSGNINDNIIEKT